MKKLILLLMVVSFSLHAQTKFNSLQECLDFSKANNPTLKIENLNQEISEEKMKSAWASLLPQVKLFGTLDDNLALPVQLVPAQFLGGNDGEYAKVKFGTQFNSTYGAEASLSLINASNWKNIKATSYAKEASKYQRADKLLSLTEQIITSYYFLLLSREAIILNQDLVSSSDSLLNAAETRLQNGLIETLEYNRVKSVSLETRQQLEESKGAFEKNLNTLKSLCGIPETDSLIVTESIAQSLQKITPATLGISTDALPRYKMLQSRSYQSLEESKRQRSRALPEVSLYARYARQAFRDEFNFFSSDEWFDVGVAGVRAEWNIFTGLNRHASIRQSSMQSKIAALELENYKSQADRELEELSINHRIAAEGVEKYQEHYLLNTANHNIANRKYSAGIYTIDQYINIYQEVVRSQNQYLNKLANYLVYESIVSSRNELK